MNIKLIQFEAWCEIYASRWNRKELWDSYILVKDAWLNGYKKAVEAAQDKGYDAKYLGREKAVEIEATGNQIGAPVLHPEETFKKEMLTHYNCSDIRIVSDGKTISFQGTFKI